MLPKLEAHKFPTFDDFVHPETFEILIPTSESLPEPPGIFEGILHNQADVLTADGLDHPEKYAPEALALLQGLSQRQRSIASLSDTERGILDKATLDFLTYVPPKTAPVAPKKAAPVRAASEDPIVGVDIPSETSVPAYWWLK